MKKNRAAILIISLAALLTGCASQPPLYRAAANGDIKTVTALVDKGTDVNQKGGGGLLNDSNALDAACSSGHIDIVKFLLDKGANVNAESGNMGWTPLSSAAYRGYTDIVSLLLDRGADISRAIRGLEQGVGTRSAIELLRESKRERVASRLATRFSNPPRETHPVFKPDVGALPLSAIPDNTYSGAFDFGDYYALVIGNNDYREIKKLHTAVSDAQTIAALLKNKYGFKTRLLLNATRADILRALNEYRRKLGPRDNLLIYYAGHGWLDKDADQGYWLPVDATERDPINWISNGSITDALRAMEAKHVLVIADSCYSGKLSRGIDVRIKTKNYYAKILAKKSRTVMASGGLEPVADEGGKGTHSVFASALIEALNENKGVIDTTRLFSQIRRPVMVNTDQTPEYSDIHKAGHDGGDFLFVRKK